MTLRKLIFTVLIVAIVLAIPFFFNEHFQFDKTINDQKLANYFVALAAITTIVTLIFLFVQVQEMKESRRASNFPDLFVKNIHYTTTDFDDVVLNQILPDFFETNSEARSNVISIKNVGVGVAKNIECKWEYDRTKVVQLIHGIYHYELDDKDDVQIIDFVEPNRECQLYAPLFYLNCCGKLLNQFGILAEKSNKPSLQLVLSYNDIHPYKYTKTFNVQVSAIGNAVNLNFLPKKLIWKEIKAEV